MEFTYEQYDVQLGNLVRMSYVLMEGWECYALPELGLDLRSLCIKASRLCGMAEQDVVLQQQDLMHRRQPCNLEMREVMDGLVTDLTLFMGQVMTRMQDQEASAEARHELPPADVTRWLKSMSLQYQQGQEMSQGYETILQNFALAQEHFAQVPPTPMPEMTANECFWHLAQLYVSECYLMFHFRQQADLYAQEVPEEEYQRIFMDNITRYKESERGAAELVRYEQALIYDHRQMPLSKFQWEQELIRLRKEVPESLQTPFMQHIQDVSALAVEVARQAPCDEDYDQLLQVVAKWQLVNQRIYEMQLPPVEQKPRMYNKIFPVMLHDQPVDLKQLRKAISRMVSLVYRKNHWFCVWCVLRKHGLVSTNMQGFARQMMHADWFGKVPRVQTVQGDNLSEYKGYFTDRPYNKWDQQSYDHYRMQFGKKKWSENLMNNFQRLCQEMDVAFEEKW